MFNEINKLFGREFVIAYLLPSIIFIALNALVLSNFGILPDWLSIERDQELKDTTVLAVIAIILSFFLSALNSPLFRLMEGYWPWGLRRLGPWLHGQRFTKLNQKAEALAQEYRDAVETNVPFKRHKEYASALETLAQDYPRDKTSLMPTTFGNIVLAFEEYPRELYGAESIQLWSRLQGIMPKEYVEYLGGLRASTDLWVSIWFLSLITLLECLIFPLVFSQAVPLPLLAGTAILCGFAVWRAQRAARKWGEGVKGAFDVFLPKLRQSLGYKPSATAEDEKRFWLHFSQALLYRDFNSLTCLDDLRDHKAMALEGNPNTPAPLPPIKEAERVRLSLDPDDNSSKDQTQQNTQ